MYFGESAVLIFLRRYSYNFIRIHIGEKAGTAMAKTNMNMLSGSLWDKIFIFAIPLAITGVIQQIFNATDVAIVGHYVGKHAMAAVGCNTPVVALMVNLFIGIALGINVVSAGFIGLNDREKISRTVHTGYAVVLVLSIFISAVAILCSSYIMGLLNVPPELMDQASLYFKIIMAGLPLTAVYNCGAAVFASHGDTRTPLLCLTVAGIINVVLNIFFITCLNMKVEGVAIATVAASAVSALMLIFFLRKDETFSFSLRQFTPDRAIMNRILKIGLPASLQGMVFSLSNTCIQSAINSLGADVMAASAAAFNIEILVYFLLNSFGQAATTFIGQNYAVGNIKRCFEITRVCLWQNMILTLLLSGFLLYFARTFLLLFTDDPDVIEIGRLRLMFILLPEGINVLLEVMSGAMRGYGRSLTPAMMALAGICGIRIIWVYTVFSRSPDFAVLMTCYPVSWFFTTLAIIIAYIRFKNRHLIPLTVKQHG